MKHSDVERNIFGKTKEELIFAISTYNYRAIAIDDILTLKELNYTIKWLKENYAVTKIHYSNDYVIDNHEEIVKNFDKLTDEDISGNTLDTLIWITKNENGFLSLDVELCMEHEWDLLTISFQFGDLFEQARQDMLVEEKELNMKELTRYIIDNFYGTYKDIKFSTKEECEDFIEYFMDNFIIKDITLVEKYADSLNELKTMKEDFMEYCQYKNYNITLSLDGGTDVRVWIMSEDLNNITDDIQIINWFDLKNSLKMLDN